MEENQAERIERIEQAQKEIHEKMMRSQEDMQRQMREMMAMISSIVKGKGIAQDGQSHDNAVSNEEPLYPPDFTPPLVHMSQGLYQQTGAASTAFEKQLVNQGQYVHQHGIRPTDPILVPNLDDPKEQAKYASYQPVENKEKYRKFELLEERIKAVECRDVVGRVDANELSLVPDLVLPAKFKIPEFEKYDGTKCPNAHITMFCRKMTGYIHNDKLLIHCFQDSLTGLALKWYNKLNSDHIRSWKDLATEFLKQYKHMVDIAPDRFSLQNMEKKPSETFKEYAHRWRELAVQVHPPLEERESAMIFINTLRSPYYEILVGNATKSFADIVTSGEMIENAVKTGRIEAQSSKENIIGKKKEEEAHAVETRTPSLYVPYQPYTYYPPHHQTANNISYNPFPSQAPFRPFDQISPHPKENNSKSISRNLRSE